MSDTPDVPMKWCTCGKPMYWCGVRAVYVDQSHRSSHTVPHGEGTRRRPHNLNGKGPRTHV